MCCHTVDYSEWVRVLEVDNPVKTKEGSSSVNQKKLELRLQRGSNRADQLFSFTQWSIQVQ
jgi:hypothetical protein